MMKTPDLRFVIVMAAAGSWARPVVATHAAGTASDLPRSRTQLLTLRPAVAQVRSRALKSGDFRLRSKGRR